MNLFYTPPAPYTRKRIIPATCATFDPQSQQHKETPRMTITASFIGLGVMGYPWLAIWPRRAFG